MNESAAMTQVYVILEMLSSGRSSEELKKEMDNLRKILEANNE